ncbi:unnamed protein product, partial [Echinostoma caproni]
MISYTDRDLNPKMSWDESIVLDCDVVTGTGNVDGLVYQWEVQYSRSIGTGTINSNESGRHRLLARSSVLSMGTNNGAIPVAVPSMNPSSTGSSQSALSPHPVSDLVRYNEPKLRIEKLNLRHNGEYRCTVVDTRRSAAGRSDTISRTFRLSVE